jgi:uncharacterized protein YdeI (YjbR/CyaY-like superfamily)
MSSSAAKRPLKTVRAKNRDEWRKWLVEHHEAEREIWLVYAKKHTGIASVRYDEAVEEALCFGWIDTTVRSIDAIYYAQRYTPRRADSVWSALNLQRVERMLESGRMLPAGLAKVPKTKAEAKARAATRLEQHPFDMPPDFARALRAVRPARRSFDAMAPSYRRQYLGWIAQAKRPETRARRIAQAVERLAEGRKLFD